MNKYFVLFLFNPAITIYSIISNRKWNSITFVYILIFFGVFFGYHFSSSALQSSDSYQHAIAFKKVSSENNIVAYVYEEFLTHGDIGIPILRYTISRFSSSEAVYFAVVGGLFMLFASQSLRLLLRLNSYNGSLNKTDRRVGAFFILIFFFVYGLVTINAVRFPIAVQIFILGFLLSSVLNTKKKVLGYVLMFVSPFFHLGLWIAIAIYLCSKILPEKVLLYTSTILIVISLLPFKYEFDMSRFSQSLGASEYEALSKRRNYVSEDYIEQSEVGRSSKNWYVTFRYDYLSFVFRILILWIFINYRERVFFQKTTRIFSFAILLIGLASVLSHSMHSIGRMGSIGLMLLIIWLIAYGLRELELNWLLRWNIYLSTVLFIIVEMRIYFYFTTIDVLVSNPILSVFFRSGYELDNFIR